MWSDAFMGMHQNPRYLSEHGALSPNCPALAILVLQHPSSELFRVEQFCVPSIWSTANLVSEETEVQS